MLFLHSAYKTMHNGIIAYDGVWNGKPLPETTHAKVTETLNGDYTLNVTYPITDSNIYTELLEDMIITASTPDLGRQPFRIKKKTETDNTVQLICQHISEDVYKHLVNPITINMGTCQMALLELINSCRTPIRNFSFYSDITKKRVFNTTQAQTVYTLLFDGNHSIVNAWEGEVIRDKFTVSIKQNRGINRGAVITTHQNLKQFERTKDVQSVITKIYAKSTFKPNTDNAQEVTISAVVDSPIANHYSYTNEVEYENNDLRTVEELQKWAMAKFKNEHIDKVNDKITVQAHELDGQVIHLGDEVRIVSQKHHVELTKKAISYEYDALLQRYISITFDDKATMSSVGGSDSVSGQLVSTIKHTSNIVNLEKELKSAIQIFETGFIKIETDVQNGIETAKSQAEVTKADIQRQINDTKNDMLKKSEVSITNDKITIGKDNVITGQKIVGMLVAGSVTGDKIMANSITGGHLRAGSVTTDVLAANAVTADKVNFNSAMINKLTSNTLFVRELFSNSLFAKYVQTVELNASKITSGILQARNDAMSINLNTANMTFNKSAGIEFKSSGNALFRKIGSTTGFVYFSETAQSSGGGSHVALGVSEGWIGTDIQRDMNAFTGIRIFKNLKLDKMEIFADDIAFSHGHTGYTLSMNMHRLKGSVDLLEVINNIYYSIHLIADHTEVTKPYTLHTYWNLFKQ